MTDAPSTAAPAGAGLRATAGLLICRIVVPLWILAGVLLKLSAASPRLLPKEMLLDADRFGLNLKMLLATLIAIEFAVIAVILFVPRLARATAVFMLACFCVILIREIAAGNASCGCLGTNSPSPWVMLAVDGALLLGVILLKPRAMPKLDGARWPLAVAGVLTVVGGIASFVRITGAPAAPVVDPVPVQTDGTTSGPPKLTHKPLPSEGYWIESDFDSWLDRHWTEIELFQFMDSAPRDMETGTRYVVFYSLSCDHCEDMFYNDLAPDPALAAMVTAVEIPPTNGPDSNAWTRPETECELMTLPQFDWIVTSPIAIRVEDGIVKCATEGDHTTCMGLEPHEP